MTRLMTLALALAFAGTLCLVGCDEQKPALTPPTPPAAKTPATPAIPATPAKPDEKKVGDATAAGGNILGITVKDAAAKVEVAATCAKEGCKGPGNPAFKVAKDGKTMLFCCNDCLTAYKTANNIQ